MPIPLLSWERQIRISLGRLRKSMKALGIVKISLSHLVTVSSLVIKIPIVMNTILVLVVVGVLVVEIDIECWGHHLIAGESPCLNPWLYLPFH